MGLPPFTLLESSREEAPMGAPQMLEHDYGLFSWVWKG